MELSMRIWLVGASLSGLMGVAMGAFGAHGMAEAQAKAWLQTGAQYQMIHALAVIAAVAVFRMGAPTAGWAAWLFLAGSLLFAGSLYLMAFGGPKTLGMVTPLGGLMLILGWAVLAGTALTGGRGTLI